MRERRTKKVMLVCGSGIVSSTLVAPMVEDILERGGWRYRLIKGRLHEVSGRLKDLDLILTTVPLPAEIAEAGVPVVVITELFAGKKEAIARQIQDALRGES